MDEHETWAAVDRQRAAVVVLLESLSPSEWATDSLCDGWTVRDVAGHLTMLGMSRPTLLALAARHPGGRNRIIREVGRSLGAADTAHLTAEVAATIGRHRAMPGLTSAEMLVDVLAHTLDITVPLGRDAGLDNAAVAAAASTVVGYRTRRESTVFRRLPLRGLRLEASDHDWQHGSGPVVSGSVTDLFLLVSGRPAGLDRLGGEGAELLRRRLHDACDTRIMGIVHAALRRDLERSLSVLDGSPEPARLQALGSHLLWVADFLHHHHDNEDHELYPRLRAKVPELAPILDAMDAEHVAVGPALMALEDVARRVGSGDPAATASDLRAAVTELQNVLVPHLEHEEDEMMPLVEANLTAGEWATYDRANQDKPQSELAFTGHWIVDGLTDPESVEVVRRLVPAVPRFVMLHLLGGAYRRRCAQLWGGTAAQAIGSSPRARVAS
ncbi:hypothetical protein GCM10009624_03510 [Gordonia sinesedis]